jgi:hypothetical protein
MMILYSSANAMLASTIIIVDPPAAITTSGWKQHTREKAVHTTVAVLFARAYDVLDQNWMPKHPKKSSRRPISICGLPLID